MALISYNIRIDRFLGVLIPEGGPGLLDQRPRAAPFLVVTAHSLPLPLPSLLPPRSLPAPLRSPVPPLSASRMTTMLTTGISVELVREIAAPRVLPPPESVVEDHGGLGRAWVTRAMWTRAWWRGCAARTGSAARRPWRRSARAGAAEHAPPRPGPGGADRAGRVPGRVRLGPAGGRPEAIAGPGPQGRAPLSDDELVGVLPAARRLANLAAYQQTVAIAEFARRRRAEFEAAKARGVPGRLPRRGDPPQAGGSAIRNWSPPAPCKAPGSTRGRADNPAAADAGRDGAQD